MWLVRLLRHRPMLICLFGHAALVAVWAFVVWSAELTEWSILCLIGCLLTPVVFFLDLPVFLLASWYSSKSIIGDVFSVNGDFFQFTLYVLLCGSVQWGLIGLFLAVWDLRRHRRKFQYSLRTRNVVMFMACIGMSWVSVRIQRARQQKEAVEAILEMGGRVWYDFLGTAFVVDCNSSQMTDDGLQDLKELTQLKRLTLGDTKVTDAGLEALEGTDTTPGVVARRHADHRCGIRAFGGTDTTKAIASRPHADHRCGIRASERADPTPGVDSLAYEGHARGRKKDSSRRCRTARSGGSRHTPYRPPTHPRRHWQARWRLSWRWWPCLLPSTPDQGTAFGAMGDCPVGSRSGDVVDGRGLDGLSLRGSGFVS